MHNLIFLGFNIAYITKFESADIGCSLKTSVDACLGISISDGDASECSGFNSNFYGSRLNSDCSLNHHNQISVKSDNEARFGGFLQCTWKQIPNYEVGYCDTTSNIEFSWELAAYYTVLALLTSIPLQLSLRYLFTNIICAPKRVNLRDNFAKSRSVLSKPNLNPSLAKLTKNVLQVADGKISQSPADRIFAYIKSIPIELRKDFMILSRLNTPSSATTVSDMLAFRIDFNIHSDSFNDQALRKRFSEEWKLWVGSSSDDELNELNGVDLSESLNENGQVGMFVDDISVESGFMRRMRDCFNSGITLYTST